MFPRSLQAEKMDEPGLDARAHDGALEGLRRINRVSRTVNTLWPLVRRELLHHSRSICLLDVATGAGDVAVGLASRARRAGLSLEVHGCDISPVAVAHARAHADRAGVRANFFEFDALNGATPRSYDIVTSTLFLHHLEGHAAVQLLRSLASIADQLLLIDDLRRCRMGMLAAQVIPRVLTRSSVVHVDAVLSVRAAFTLLELREMAASAGLQGAQVRPHFPWRQMLVWRPTA